MNQKYLDDSGDKSVGLKQRLHETKEDAHKLLGLLIKMARNIHGTFHELILPMPEPINAFKDEKARIEALKRQRQG